MDETTAISTADQLCEETQAWLHERGFQTLGDLTEVTPSDLEELPHFEDYFLWEVEDALSSCGLALRSEPPPEHDPHLGVLTLEEWTRRLAALCPQASALTPEEVRATLKKRGFAMEHYDSRLSPSYFKYVLGALAKEQASWLYFDDWRGPRDEAARAFEKLLDLPPNHLTPESDAPLDFLAGDANTAAEKLNTSDARIDSLAPYDDDCVFACMTNELRDALIAAFVLAPKSVRDYQTRGEEPLTLTPSTELHGVDAFADDAHNLLQSMGLRTVADLLAKRAWELQELERVPGTVAHIQDVLTRAGLSSKPPF